MRALRGRLKVKNLTTHRLDSELMAEGEQKKTKLADLSWNCGFKSLAYSS